MGGRALQAVQAGRWEDAIGAYRRMLELDPANAGVRFDYALALHRLGRARESLAVLGTASGADAWALAGADLRMLGKPREAANMLRRAFTAEPTAAVAYDLGLALLDLEQHAEAERVFRRFPDDLRCLVGIGLVTYATGRNAEAEQAFEKAAARQPDAADIQASLGDVRFATGLFEQAASAYAAAMRREPGSAEYQVKAARNLGRLGRQEEGTNLYRQALRLDPLQAEANTELAQVYTAKGERAEARRLLETAIAAEPGKPNAYYRLMLLCRAMNDSGCADTARRSFDRLRREESPVRVEMSAPSVIVEGPAEERRWGRYQFPTMHRMADGRLIAQVHVEADSATSYGFPRRVFVSSDDGFSWSEDTSALQHAFGLRLRNGEWLRIDTPPSLDAASLTLPEKAGTFTSYSTGYSLYRLRDLAAELRLIFFQRFAGGKWAQESTALSDASALRYVVQGRFPRIWWGDMRVAANGSLLAVTYPFIADQQPFRFGVAAWRSTDSGHTWQLRGRIPYQPDPAADDKADARDGFTEPAFEILPDGSLYTVLRTTDGHGIGPMYEARSRDLGRTWTQPRMLAGNGVLPRLLRLENGILVLASGRPGVQLRFSADGGGQVWSDPWDLLAADPAKPQADSCGYTDLVALDRDSFLIIYSWFQKPDASGRPRKAILVRRIRAIRPEPPVK